jgi:phosphoglycolate/pyridoxal phosphate phosphatase family enzyme
MKSLLDLDAYLFDLDGTVYTGNKLMPGVYETLTELRRLGKQVLFITNTTLRAREAVREHLLRLGIWCRSDEIMTALCASTMYFREEMPDAKVLVIGETVMRKELERGCVQTTEKPTEATHVLVGMDRQFTYEKLRLGMVAVRHGATLIAANPDPYCPTEDGAIPDTWPLAKAIEVASQIEISEVIGKPSPYFARKVLERMGVAADRCLMVGDRLETDILFGVNSGMQTALVLTGASGRKDIDATGIRPCFVLTGLNEMIRGLLHYG